jgi:hypothetical protein
MCAKAAVSLFRKEKTGKQDKARRCDTWADTKGQIDANRMLGSSASVHLAGAHIEHVGQLPTKMNHWNEYQTQEDCTLLQKFVRNHYVYLRQPASILCKRSPKTCIPERYGLPQLTVPTHSSTCY